MEATDFELIKAWKKRLNLEEVKNPLLLLVESQIGAFEASQMSRIRLRQELGRTDPWEPRSYLKESDKVRCEYHYNVLERQKTQIKLYLLKNTIPKSKRKQNVAKIGKFDQFLQYK